jgi:hypothetical protein
MNPYHALRTFTLTGCLALLAGLAHAAAPEDPCAGSPRCYNAGKFIEDVVQVSASAMNAGARHQSVVLNIRFRNVTDKPIILAYRSGSSAALDNFGNGYTWGRPGTHDTSVKGIGLLTGRSVDTQYALAPGQSRSATFNIIRFNARPPIGNAWNYDVVIDEVEVLPGQVVRSARQNSLSFPSLTAGTCQGGGADVASKVLDLLNRSKKN